MLSNKQMKNKAIGVLQKNWVKPILVRSIEFIISIIVSIIILFFVQPVINEFQKITHLIEQNMITNQEAMLQISQNINKVLAIHLIGILNILAPLILTVPISHYFIQLMDNSNAKFRDSFKNIGGGAMLVFLMSLKIFLWSLLFIIPGIYKAFCYSQAPFIKAEHPEYSANECLRKSQDMMYGHKLRLFMFYISFFGWFLLQAVLESFIGLIPGIAGMIIIPLSNGIISLILTTYITMGETVFYMDLANDYNRVGNNFYQQSVDPFGNPINNQSSNIDPFDGKPINNQNNVDPFSGNNFDFSQYNVKPQDIPSQPEISDDDISEINNEQNISNDNNIIDLPEENITEQNDSSDINNSEDKK